MASKQSVRKPYLLICVLLLFTWITVSDGVKIEQKTFTSVTVTDTEEVVTLPCNFITSPYEAPVITWLWYTDKDTRQVTRFENQQLFSQKEFSTRVARGDKGALVLIRPTLHDSGNYSCEVQVEKENPRFAITFIALTVRPSSTEVTIPKVHRQVKAVDTDTAVTLPCDFTADGPAMPRIIWRLFKKGYTQDIGTFDKDGAMSLSDQFLGRIARGNRGDLVLISPRVEDTGTYKCTIQVGEGTPVTADVKLSVSSSSDVDPFQSTEVTISKVHRQVKVVDTDTSVTLPCNFTADGPAIPRIIWRLVKKGYRQAIGTFNKDGAMSVSDQFVGRIARGNRGDLVLIAPRVENSGTYTCAIQVDNGNPVTADVTLLVSRNSDANQLVPFQSAGLEVFVCILWIITVFCGFVLEEKWFARIIHTFRTVTSPKQLVIKGCRYIVIVLALCLIFSGTACSVKALRSRDQTYFNYNRAVGYGTGIVGIAILCGVHIYVALTKLCRVKCSRKDTTEKSCDKSDIEKTEDSDNSVDYGTDRPEQEQTELISQVEGNKTNSADYTVAPTSYEPSAEKEVKQHEILTLSIPNNEKVTWMTSQSAEVAYFTTQGSLYRLDLSPEANRPEFVRVCEREGQLLTVSTHKQGLLLLVKRIDKGTFTGRLYDVYTVMLVQFREKTFFIVFSSEHCISFVLSELHREHIYVIYPNTQEIVKAIIKEKEAYKTKYINTCVLKYPTCMAKNSREQIIVTDSEKNDVFVFDENNGFVTSMKISVPKDLEPELQGCNRLAVGPDDRIYVTGPFTRYVFVFGADFRYERVIQTDTDTSGQISCLMIHDNSLYVAHSACIRVYPLRGN